MIEARLGLAALVGVLLSACAETGPFFEPTAPRPEPEAALSEGRLQLRMGEYDLAYNAFITALRTGDSPAEALTGAGLALEAQGLLTRAREHFERAAELAPGSDVAHNNLGVVHYRLGDYARARRSFRTAFAVSSGRSTVAATNLRAAERALAARAAPADIGSGLNVQRVGSSVYRLVPAAAADAQTAADEAPQGAEEAPLAAAEQPERRADPHPPLAAAAPTIPADPIAPADLPAPVAATADAAGIESTDETADDAIDAPAGEAG